MSNTARWIIAIGLILLGIAAAATAFFGGAFSTVGCLKSPPDWVYYVLILASLVTLAGAAVPAIMLIRRAAGRTVVLSLVVGLLLACAGYGAYMASLAGYC